MEQLLANLAGKVQRKTLQGRQYYVAPLSMIVPGVLNGSKGPLYYPAEEIARNADAWNGMPIVVNHPVANGKPTSARKPSILEAYQIGTVFETNVDGKLAAEGWFDIELTRKIEPTILNRLEQGDPIELSTGLFTENEEQAGDFNGTPYTHIARNYRPDHLAVLPNQRGACSLKDGCGVLINEESKQTLWNRLGEMLGLFTSNAMTPEDEKAMQGMTPEQRKKYMADKQAKMMASNADGQRTGSSISQEEEERQMKLTDNERKAIVTELVANCDCWKGDEKTLNGFTDEKLTALKKQHDRNKQLELTANAAEKGVTDKEGNQMSWNAAEGKWDIKPAEKKPDAKPTDNAEVTPLKPSQDNAASRLTPEEQEAIDFARNERKRQKDELIGRLTANVKGDAEKKAAVAVYNAMKLEDLQAIAKTMPQQSQPQPIQSYFGQQGAPVAPVVNRPFDEEDGLDLPTYNWAEMSAELSKNRVAAEAN